MSRRVEQINSIFRKDIAEFISKQAVVNNGIITVTYVHCNDDLSSAEVGLISFPAKQSTIDTAIKLLEKSRNELQLKLSRSHNLKRIPHLRFVPDMNQHKVQKIDELLKKVSDERS